MKISQRQKGSTVMIKFIVGVATLMDSLGLQELPKLITLIQFHSLRKMIFQLKMLAAELIIHFSSQILERCMHVDKVKMDNSELRLMIFLISNSQC